MFQTRRFAFFSLLVFAVAAPIGWVAASAPSQPYVVLFNDGAVTVADAAPSLSGSSLSYLLAANTRATIPAAAVAGASDGVGDRRVDPDRVARHIQDLAARNGVSDITDVYSSAVGGFAARLTAAQSAAIAADPSVGVVIPDEAISADDIAAGLGGGIRTTSNPTNQVQPGIRRIGARSPTIAALTAGGLRVNADVAIIDTGIQRNHPDLNVAGGYNCTGRDRTKWDDNDGHGTHVAGIVGALDNRFGVTGVAPGVRLWAVKVLDGNGRGFVSWLVCGVDWVSAQRDPANASRPLIEVANMSLAFTLAGGNDANCGRTNNDMLHLAICRAVDRGITFVVAAGNDSKNVRTVRPAAYNEVITVSALADYDGRGGARGYPGESCPYWSSEPDDAFTSFSNYGADVDLIAPGKCILSTYLNSRYAWMSGTSMATPHVTGAAVLYKTMNPGATPEQVRMALEAVGTLDWRTATDPDNFHEKAVWIGAFRSVPDFGVTSSLSSAVVSPGTSLAVDVALNRVGGFDAAVTVSLVNPPSGISATPVVTRADSARLTVRVAPGTRLGHYSVTIAGATPTTERVETITVAVYGTAPQSAFISPRADLTVQAGAAVSVAWTEQSSGADISARRLDRQVATIRTPGTCGDAMFTTQQSRSNAIATTDHVAPGYCYRWVLTLTDSAGVRSTAYSGTVLVDATAPRAPSLQLAADAAYAPDIATLGIGPTYLSGSNTMWIRSGVAGSLPLQVDASDPESGINLNVADLSGSGWSVSWAGRSAVGSLRLSYARQSAPGRLAVGSVNGAGVQGPQSALALARDGSAPSAPSWLSAIAGATRTIHGSYFRLEWSAATDTGSGLGTQMIVGRYRSTLNADGTCKTNGFSPDGGFRLAADGSWDSGLVAGSCYVWSVRSIDNVGNMSPSSVSGYVITKR